MNFFDNLFFIQSIDETEDGFTARLLCNPSHPVYKAHFPGNPITPGVCVMQMASTLFGKKLNQKVWLKAAKSVKFLSAIIPAEGKEVKFGFSRIVESGKEIKAQVLVSDDSVTFAKMSLIFSNVLV